MTAGPSLLSLCAAIVYLIVGGAAAFAAITASRFQQVAWHRIGWMIVVAIFVGLAAMRIFAAEDQVREALRLVLYAEQSYDERRDFQKPLIAIVFVVALILSGGTIYALAERVQGRRNFAAVVALACSGGLLFLLVLRLVSLHSIDALLYGPMKLNWFADLGLTGAVLACAVRYCLVIRGTAR